MKLRIYRTFKWVSAVPDSEIRLGGRSPLRLKGCDELQYYHESGEWRAVSIVEGKKPENPHDEEDRKSREQMVEKLKDILLVDCSQQCLTNGQPVTPDHREIQANGMQKAYVVLTPEERAKGFVRPVRKSYRHLGLAAPKNPLRDLTAEEHESYSKFGYVKYEEYPKDSPQYPVVGIYWTQDRLNRINQGCGVVTTMGVALAETYARDPSFYGSTFCCGCGKHLPVEEFVWDGIDERVGS